MEKFTFFWDGPCSQWYPSTFTVDGIVYDCAEQFMMADKARTFNDIETLALIMRPNQHPRDQKALGRVVKGYIDALWNGGVSVNSVYKGNHAKFTQNKPLLDYLESTKGTTLVEASPYDKIWGIGLLSTDPRAQNRATWLGTNWLGETQTKLRIDLFGA